MATAHSSRTTRGADSGEEVAPASRRYLLPLAGAAAVGAGGLALAGVGPVVSPYVAAGLVAVGAVALVSSVSYHRLRSPSPAAAAPPALARPRPAPGGRPARPESTPHSGLGRVASSSVSWSGEEIWQRWRRPAGSHLGAEVIPPVGSTAYVPPRSGSLHPFGARDRDLWFMPSMPLPPERRGGRSVPSPPRAASAAHSHGTRSLTGRRFGPFSDDELDRLFPPEPGAPDPVSAPARPSPAAVPLAVEPPATEPPAPSPLVTLEEKVFRERSPPAADGFSGDVGGPWSGVGALSGAGAIDHLLYLEALNPVPPHLRTSTEEVSLPTPTVVRSPPAAVPRSCGSCRRGLGDFRTWSSCARCGRPICRRCLGLSIRFGEDGVCWDCSESALAQAS